MSIYKRYLLFTLGMFSMAFGISCVIKSMLGSSPISSIPYVLNLEYPLSIGTFTFIVNMIFLLIQILLLRKNFQAIQLLQIPITIIFSFFIDLSMHLLAPLTPELYSSRLITVLIGTSFLSFGVSLEMIGNVVKLAGEGIVHAIAITFHLDFGNTKTGFDLSLVIITAVLSWIYFGEFRGIREGTLISAMITGTIARFFIRHLSYINKNGELIFQMPFFNTKSTNVSFEQNNKQK